jgi:hypothetical protein
LDGGCRLQLLQNDDGLLVDDATPTKPSKAVKSNAGERVCKERLRVNRRAPASARTAERARGTKSKVGEGHGQADRK